MKLASPLFAKFLLVGGSCALANSLVMWIATDYLHWHYLVSLTFTFLTVNAAGYILNKYFTFGRSDTPVLTELAHYYRVMLGSLLFGLSAMFVLVDVVGLHYMVALVGLMASLTLRNFLRHRDRTFA